MINSEVITDSDFNKLLFDEIKCFESILNENVIYDKHVHIESKMWNYINSVANVNSERTIKPLIENLVVQCENLSPGLGQTSLEMLMDYLQKNKSLFVSKDDFKTFERKVLKPLDDLESKLESLATNFHKSHLTEFLNNDIGDENKEFINDLINLMSLTTKVFVENGLNQKTVLRSSTELNFNVSFDKDFLIKDKWEARDYKFIIIDGFIDSVGEIIHLLEEANKTGEPYVIFCKGMRQEVKNVIIQNLMRETINVFPVSLEINETNVNFLADIAACHNSDITTHLKGDTISSAVRRKLSIGKKIKVDSNGFTLSPVATKSQLNRHLRYLEKRKQNSEIEANTSILEKRIKMMSSEKLIVSLGKVHQNNKLFMQDVNKALITTKQFKTGCIESNDLEYFSNYFKSYIPLIPAILTVRKVKSVLTLIYNTTGCIIFN